MRNLIIFATVLGSGYATNPCQRLCDLDGPDVCTNGSYPRNGDICHAYFRLPNNGHCYHTSATQQTCPAHLPPLTVQEASAIVAGRPYVSPPPHRPTNRPVYPTTTTPRPTTLPSLTFATFGAAADFIGAAFDATPSNTDNLPATIATAFTRPGVSSWPSRVSEADAMDFWTRARGPAIFELARRDGNCHTSGSACHALMTLVSNMPLPNTDASDGMLFMEQIGVMEFVETNAESLRQYLTTYTGGYYASPYTSDLAASKLLRSFAANWLIRFPQVIGDSLRFKSIVLSHRIRMFDPITSSHGYYDERSLTIERRNPLRSTASQIGRWPAANIRRGLSNVRYAGESAGGGGLTREYFSVIASSVMGSGPNALFATNAASGYERMIPGTSDLELYRTLGKYFALSIVHGYATGIRLPTPFFSRLLGLPVTLNDVRGFDEGWFNTARRYMSARTQEEILSFSLGEPEPFPGSGLDEPVTLDNRDYQLQQAINNMISNNLPDQFDAIAEGLFFVLPRSLFEGLDGSDLQAIIVGNTDVSADELIAHLSANLGGNRTNWLHQIIREFTPQLRQRFLRFVTGLSVVPAAGWSGMNHLSIHRTGRMSGGRISLPRAQTCSSSLTLPDYDSLEEMREILTNVLTHSIDAGMQER